MHPLQEVFMLAPRVRLSLKQRCLHQLEIMAYKKCSAKRYFLDLRKILEPQVCSVESQTYMAQVKIGIKVRELSRPSVGQCFYANQSRSLFH